MSAAAFRKHVASPVPAGGSVRDSSRPLRPLPGGRVLGACGRRRWRLIVVLLAAASLCQVLLVTSAVAGQSRSAVRRTPPCKHLPRRWGPPLSAAQRQQMRVLVHRVAQAEGVDPYLLEAIGMNESGLNPSTLGSHCEIGAFQLMPGWAEVFGLSSPRWFYDARVGAIAAARVLRHALRSWKPEYARAAANPRVRKAGYDDSRLRPEGFAAICYNWGACAGAFRKAGPTRVKIPKTTCRYLVNFTAQYARARQRGPAAQGAGRPAQRPPASPAAAAAGPVAPVAGPFRLVSPYGAPRGRRRHRGVDLAPLGDGVAALAPVLAVDHGVVIEVRDARSFERAGGRLLKGAGWVERGRIRLPRSATIPGYRGVVHPVSSNHGPGRTGLWVAIAHDRGRLKGLVSHYMHLAGVRVRKGQRVQRGQEIGRVGATAIVHSPPHLHFAIARPARGSIFSYVDPTAYMPNLAVPRSERREVALLATRVARPSREQVLLQLEGLLRD